MGLIEQAKQDLQDITSNQDLFGKQLSFVSRKGPTVVIYGLHSRHHSSYNENGEETNTVTAHCSFSEKLLTDLGYPVRDQNEVDLKGDFITIQDGAGIDRKYKIQQAHPSETLGYIRCRLSDSK